MTITSLDTRANYGADGSSTVFPVPFQFFGPDELRVYQTTAGGAVSTLVRGTDYTVLGGNGASGSVVAVAAPVLGTVWSIVRATTPTQQVRLNNADPLPGPTMERMADRLTALAQEFTHGLGRTLRLPPGEATDAPLLPAAVDRAGLALTFDSNGAPVATALPTGSVAVSAPMLPVIAAATLRTARQTLGARDHIDAVRDYGVDNTFATDTAAALAAAIAAAPAGTVVYLRPGTYKIGSAVPLKPGVALVGEGPFLTTLVASANNVHLLTYTAAALVNDITIRRIGFSNGGFSGVRGIRLDGVDATKRISLVSLEDLYISGGDRGVDLKFCANSIITGARTNTSTIGIYLDNCSDTEVNGGWSQNGGDAGIYILGGGGAFDEGVRVTGYATNGQVKGIEVNGQDWGQLTGVSLTTCTGGPLIFINSSNWQIVGGQFATGTGSPAAPAITCDVNCSGLQITGCLVPVSTFGINLLGSAHVITGNRLTGNSNADINLAAVNCVVTGNLCQSTGVAASIVEQAGSDYNGIAANVTTGTVTITGANTVVSGANVVF
jgi:hypothetical protein